MQHLFSIQGFGKNLRTPVFSFCTCFCPLIFIWFIQSNGRKGECGNHFPPKHPNQHMEQERNFLEMKISNSKRSNLSFFFSFIKWEDSIRKKGNKTNHHLGPDNKTLYSIQPTSTNAAGLKFETLPFGWFNATQNGGTYIHTYMYAITEKLKPKKQFTLLRSGNESPMRCASGARNKSHE